jgi:hypothetical protein
MNRDSMKPWAFLLTFCLLGFALFALVGCTSAEVKSGIIPFFDAIATGATAAGIPWAAPIFTSAGHAIDGLFGTSGAMAAAGALVHHHVHFGVTPGRRKKLAAKREAHRAAPKAA